MQVPNQIIIPANEHVRMKWYQSQFSRDYLMAKQDYESRRKKWKVVPDDNNRFTLIDSSDEETVLHYSPYIKNCSCADFINSETGFCQHLYVLENNYYTFKDYLVRDNPTIYVDYPAGTLRKLSRRSETINSLDLDEIKVDNLGVALTPAVEGFLARKRRQLNTKFEMDLQDYSLFNLGLYQHQKESIQKMLYNKRTILTLRMGLGKTICALYCCKVLSNAQRIIIVCPNSLKHQWKREIDRFDLGEALIISKGKDLLKYEDQRFVILSYEMLNRHPGLLAHEYDIAILDEIQKIKNGESKSWETIQNLRSEFVFSLSGTPIQNNITDLISILKIISPREFSPDWKFYENYCTSSRTRLTGWNRSNLPQLKEMLREYIINPKINWQDFKLPTKTTHVIECALDPVQASVHEPALEQAKRLLSKAYNYPLTFKEKAILNGLLLKCRRAVSDGRLVSDKANKSSRFHKLEELIVDKVKNGEKVVVYSEWIDCLKLLVPRLAQEEIKHVMFTGELSDKAKNRNLEEFISEEDVKVFLSTDSGGLGVDGLQLVSKTIIHVEDIWNPMKLAQRDGRLVRALQPSDNVDIYIFDSKSGIEEMLKANKAGKHQIINDVMG